jgi:hypothetical protein
MDNAPPKDNANTLAVRVVLGIMMLLLSDVELTILQKELGIDTAWRKL